MKSASPFPRANWLSVCVLSLMMFFSCEQFARAAHIDFPPHDTNVLAGSNATFNVSARTAPLSYRWQFNGTDLANGGRISGATSSNLLITAVVPSDAGGYRVVVSNSTSVVTSSVAALTVVYPPGITNQPQSQIRIVGGAATLAAGVGGTMPINYRWFFNGSPLTDGGRISGSASPSLGIAGLLTNDTGNYVLVATNAYARATSAVARLDVRLSAAGTVRYVNLNNPGPAPPFDTWSNAATNIQDAIDAANPGEQILATNGVYSYGNRVTSATTNCVAAVIPVSIASVSGAGQTIIDGGGLKRCVYLADGAALSGFTLTNGTTSENGGGLYCESTNAAIANCVLSGNSSGYDGGGVCSGTLTNCTLAGNSAEAGGAAVSSVLNNCFLSGNSGIYGGGATYSTLNNCTLSNNSYATFPNYGTDGGGAYSSTLNGCTLIANSASDSGGAGSYCTMSNCTLIANSAGFLEGGGVDGSTLYSCTLSNNSAGQWGGNAYGSTLNNCLVTGGATFTGGGANNCTLNRCVVSNNLAYYGEGGGAYNCTLSNCVVTANSAGSSGGGANASTLINCIISNNGAPYGGGVNGCTATNCTLAGNLMNDPAIGAGGGANGSYLYNCLLTGNSSVIGAGGAEQSTLVNCTVVGNSALGDGGGVDSSRLTNCIVYFNTSPGNGNYSGTNYMSWCCTTPLPNAGGSDVVIGVSNLSSAPDFADAGNGNFRLAAGSPCMGAGNYAAAPGAVELDGNPRTVDGTVDLGAYEAAGAPFIAIQPTNQTVPLGQPSVSFSVVVIGRGVVTYQWQFNGTNILNATNSTLLLNFVQYANAGAYSVFVTNGFGAMVSSNAVLTVVPPTPPSFVLQPTNQIITPVGSNITLTLQAVGVPAPAYQWYFNGAMLTDNFHYTGTTSTNLQIFNVQTNDSGNYFVVATNVGGAATSTVAAVTVFIPAAILLSPASQTLLQGSNVNFTAVASGSPPLGYQWFFNGNPLTDGGQFNGTATTNLTVTNLQSTNTGNYVLLVTNNYSSATSAVAALTVVFPAAITLQPTNQTVLLGSNVIFAVVSGGTTPLSYRWYANGVALANGGRISGATSANLTIATAQAGDAVSYQVIITNNYSSTTSQMATLTVVVPAQITGQPASQPVLLGSNATLTVTATGSGALNYQWYFNGAALADAGRISGSGTPALSLTNVQSSDAGGYLAVVTNLWGAATSRVASLTPQAVLASSIRYVAVTGTNATSPYLDWSTAATNIQDAVDAAVAGDSIVVTDGVYSAGSRVVYGAATNRVVVDKAITVQSVNGPFTTIIQGGGSNPQLSRGSVIRCAYLTNGATLIGFTLTNGGTISSTNIYLEASGGGVWCEGSSAVISNCVFVGNSAQQFGGGAFCGTLFSCLLTNNNAGQGGGACSNTLFNCTLIKNTASVKSTVNGGGGAVYSSLSNCLLVANTSIGLGGGAFLSTLNHCVLSNNVAASGGGTCMGTIFNSLISSNRATSVGGGAYSNSLFNCIVKNNFSGNLGGGGYNSAFTSCTVVSNSAAGSGSSGFWGGTATNSIIYYNAAGGNIQDGRATVYCCTTVSGSVTNPPLFVGLAGGDYHLQSNSPCINSGNNTYVVGAADFDGNPRIQGGTVDIGAYEYQTPASVLSYAWLQQYGLPIDGSVDYSDLDGTGMNNWQKWIAGLNPTNPASVLALLPPVVTNSPAGVTVIWQSVNTRTYFLQRATNLRRRSFPAFVAILWVKPERPAPPTPRPRTAVLIFTASACSDSSRLKNEWQGAQSPRAVEW